MKKLILTIAFASLAVFAVGCNPDSNSATAPTDDHGEESHDHADHTAPHGGDLIDLGRDHAYHAELVDDHETKMITLYIMDKDLKPLSIDAATVTLVLTGGKETESFDLAAVTPGGSMEFSSPDAKMMELIDTPGITGKLRVTIEGKPFTGSFTHDHDGHDHDHEGHDHEGDSHEDHDDGDHEGHDHK